METVQRSEAFGGRRRVGSWAARKQRGSRRARVLAASSVLAAAGTLLGGAPAVSAGVSPPASSPGGAAVPSGSPSSSFRGSGTLGGSGRGDGGGGSAESGSVGLQGGDSGGALIVPSAGPGGALAGMTVEAVRRLQADLARLGYFHHAVTGYYGAVTTAAVKRFQRAVGLKADGVWGRRSAALLAKRLSG
jgi:hypothetical protein